MNRRLDPAIVLTVCVAGMLAILLAQMLWHHPLETLRFVGLVGLSISVCVGTEVVYRWRERG